MLRVSLYFVLLSVVIGCSTTDSEIEEVIFEEEFPKVDLKKFHTEKYENEFQVLILNDLTKSRIESDQALIGYSHLSKEKHVYVERELISTYEKSLKARKMVLKDILLSFAEEYSTSFKEALKTSSSSILSKSKVNSLDCFRTNFEGGSYGFPKTKYFSIRYFSGKKFIYTVVCWTVDKSQDEFENEALAVGLSFKEI